MKILAIQLGRIGDMILLTPAFTALKRNFPDCEISVIASRSNYFIPQSDPRIAKTFIYRKTPLEIIKLYRALKSEHFDFYVDHKDHFSHESSYFARIINAKTKIGYNDPLKRDFFDIAIKSEKENEGKHFVDRALSAYMPIGIEPEIEEKRPSLFIDGNSESYLLDWLKKEKIDNYIVFNISTHLPIRNWTIENWAKLARHAEDSGKILVISSSLENRDQALQIISNCKKAKIFPSRSISDAIALVAKSDLVASPDTSFIHISAAFNKPTLALYGSDPFPLSKFKPLSERYELIAPNNGEYVQDISYEQALAGFERLSNI